MGRTLSVHAGMAGAPACDGLAAFHEGGTQGQPGESQLQYSQTALLTFNGLSSPRVTAGTLRKA